MKRVMVVIGTRPEAIKLAPLVKELRRSRLIETLICATGQHRELLDQALTGVDLAADLDLDLMQEGQELATLAGRAVPALDRAIAQLRPQIVVVQGDTTTTFAGALAAFYRGVQVAHVEAGLRTRDLRAPFPEEANRRITSCLAQWHFAPTARARDALFAEGHEGVHLVGNTIVDATLDVLARVDANPQSITRGAPPAVLQSLAPGHRRVMVTVHRRESFGAGLQQIAAAVARLAEMHPHLEFILPLHPNPNVEPHLRAALGHCAGVILTPPLAHSLFLTLLRGSALVLTDSGGVQEEAATLGVPMVVMREVTERSEVLASSLAALAGNTTARIVECANAMLGREFAGSERAAARALFGDGLAARRIARLLGAVDLEDVPPLGAR